LDFPDLPALRILDLIGPKAIFDSTTHSLWTVCQGLDSLQGSQDLHRPNVSTGASTRQEVAKGNGPNGNRVGHIHANSNTHHAQTAATKNQSRKQTSQFAGIDEEIVGPFDLDE
jgi:hypothetical protein